MKRKSLRYPGRLLFFGEGECILLDIFPKGRESTNFVFDNNMKNAAWYL